MQTTNTSKEVQGTGIAENTNEVVSLELGNKVLEVLDETGLNWTVRKEDLISTSGLQTPNSGVFRNDTNEWLGTVSKKYTPYQNADMVKTIVEAGNHIGLDVSRGGFLNNGKQVYIQMELTPEFIGKSEIKRYVTALNSHTGLSSIAFGSTNTVVICQNTFHKAYKDLQRFRHTSAANEKIKVAILELKNAILEDVKLMDNFKIMSSITLQDEIIHKVVTKSFDIDLDKNSQDSNARKLKRMQTIVDCIEKEKSLEGNTLWGLFNGITRYTNHHAHISKTKEEYVINGQGYQTNLIAFDTIMEWVEKNTKEVEVVSI